MEKGVLKNFAKFIGNTCARVYFKIKLQVLCKQLYWKRDSGTGVFLWIFEKVLRTPFFTEHLLWLLLLFWVEYFCYSNLLLQRMLILEFKSIRAFRRSRKSHIDYRFSTTLPLDIKVSKSIICCLEEVCFCLISSLFCLLNLPYILYLHISLRNTYFFAIKHLISEILIWNRLI